LNNELQYDESEVLKRLSHGDEKAFRTIYDLYRKKIAAFAWLLTESEELTDEIIQEVFVKLWINRSKLDNVNNFNAWLHTVARNLVSDAMKKLAKQRTVVRPLKTEDDSVEGYSADAILFAKENEKLLKSAIAQLTPQQQEILRLSKEQGLKNDEIAGKLGINPMTVKNHLINAKRSIREYFKQHADLIVIAATTTVAILS
jgi:RNA polymerase sigma-70 factor (ECF subfamily)